MKMDQKTYSLTDPGSFGKIALILGIIGLAGCAAGYFVDPGRFFHSYLTAFSFWTTLGLGALFFLMLHHLTGATWSIVIRRIPESLMSVLPYMALFFIPIIFGMKELYHWSHPEIVAGDHLLQGKASYLNARFFIIRAVAFFVVWFFLSRILYKNSINQDSGSDGNLTDKLRKISAPGMILFAFTVTYAAFDWLMSMDAHWYSTIFGVYIFAGGLVSALAFFSITVISLQKNKVLETEITSEHYHDLGKLTFAFMIFWAYVAFSQYFLIWYANIPEETIWFDHRYQGGWKYATLLIVFGYFVMPFIILISRGAKRNLTLMRIMAFWLLFMHWLDLYWIIMPNHEHYRAMISWIDIAAMMGVGGIYLWLFWRKFSSNPIVPVGDARLGNSVNTISN